MDNSLLAESSKAEKRNYHLDFCVKLKNSFMEIRYLKLFKTKKKCAGINKKSMSFEVVLENDMTVKLEFEILNENQKLCI